MRPAARLAAAIEVLDSWLADGAPAERLIARWGQAHRFAGRQDRAAIGDLVYTALRRRSGAAALMGAETARALVLGALVLDGQHGPDALAALLAQGGAHAPPPLGESERRALDAGLPADTAPWAAGNYPAWLHEALGASLGSALAAEMTALSGRAPLDLRVNTLKATPAEARAALSADGLEAEPCRYAGNGLRLASGAPATRSRAFAEGLVEIQDEGSQLASLLCGAAPGMTVIDLAAGAGGKSLALAAAMADRGRIVAADIDAERLGRLPDRAARAGARIIETRVLQPWTGGADRDFADLGQAADLVVLDAPCSGSGTWRRQPEAKWRLTPERLDALAVLQGRLLDRAARLVRPGGRLAYLTCSLLDVENSGAIHAFLQRNEEFAILSPRAVLEQAGLATMSCQSGHFGVVLTPARTGTDGFFAAFLQRMAPSHAAGAARG